MLNMEFLTKNRGHDIKIYNGISQFSIFRKKKLTGLRKRPKISQNAENILFLTFFSYSPINFGQKKLYHILLLIVFKIVIF